MKKLIISKEKLEELLKTMNPYEIAQIYNCNVETIRRRMRDYQINRSRHAHLINEEFFDTWSNDMAYILGFTFADGSVSTKLHHNKLVYQLKDSDREILDFIISKIQPSRNLYFYTRMDKRSGKVYNIVMTDFSSKKIIQSLAKLGCIPDKTYQKINLPIIPEEFLGDFLRGLFDGDGSINSGFYNGRYKVGCSICCHQKLFLEEIKNRIGFGNITNDKTPKISFSSKSDIKRFYNLLYKNNSTFCLSRKFSKFTEVINE